MLAEEWPGCFLEETPRSVLNRIFMNSFYQGLYCSNQTGSQALVMFFLSGQKNSSSTPCLFNFPSFSRDKKGGEVSIWQLCRQWIRRLLFLTIRSMLKMRKWKGSASVLGTCTHLTPWRCHNILHLFLIRLKPRSKQCILIDPCISLHNKFESPDWSFCAS